MRTLNFNHLYYFWVAARHGSITGASRELHLTQPTLSTQIKQLEKSMGAPLFARRGRELVLTGTGQLVKRHADEMFRACESMVRSMAGRAGGAGQTLTIAVSSALPKLVVRQVLAPVQALRPALRFVIHEWPHEAPMMELAVNRVDLILNEFPAPPSAQERFVSKLMGESAVAFYALPEMVRRYKRDFPGSLNGAPFVLPTRGAALRDKLDRWFEAQEIRPLIAAEADDRSMINFLGQGGFGIIAAATIIEPEIARQFGVVRLGILKGVRDEYYAVTTQDRLEHPGVAALFVGMTGRAPQPVG